MDALPVSQLPVSQLAVGLTLIGLALAGALVLWWRGRRPAAPAVDDLVEPGPDDDAEPATVRALRAQVRVLEEALEAAGDTSSPPAPDPDASYRGQVGIAVRAVALRTDADDDPRHVAARVAAAIARLDQPDVLARVLLPEVPGGVPATPSFPPPPTLVTRPLPAPASPTDDDELDAVAEIGAGRTPEPEVVLPVPPPAPVEPRRGRRRTRHPAA